ncbi:sensor histidine kinase [Magnetospirillum molischianum]|uniref:histidine kinase n=1 Tax=Magnetospirillum molischianum DSM 120 TaxID=1150626 RepID=H8FQ72_MAGML|nr:sensor histidine kinase [Magnetospirillum molischianum]CCG40510.1 Putative two-component sensor histidine kinase, classical system [Magnetospirillum molischianum DSM 120]
MPLSSLPVLSGLRRIFSSRQGWLVGFWLICVTLIGLWFHQSAVSDQRNTLKAAEARLSAQIELASIEINGKIESGDLALRTIIALLGANPNWRNLPRDPMLWRIMNNISESMMAKPRLVLIDDKGQLRLHSHVLNAGSVSLTDRDYFQHHRDDPSEEPFLGTPVRGKIADSTVIPFTHRISLPDGNFAGVVLTSLDPAIYSAFFRSLDHDNQIVFTLLRGDGIVLVRHPSLEGAVGSKIDLAALHPPLSSGEAFGSSITVSPMDGIERLSSFRRLERFDLTIVASLPVENALKPWREQNRRMEVVIAACIFLMTVAGLVLLRHMRAETEAWARIAASEAGLNRAQAVARVGSWQAHLPELSLTCSAEASRLFALPIGRYVRGEDVLERIHPEDRERVLGAVRKTRMGHPLDIEHRLLIDGTVTWIRLRAEVSSQSADGSGEILGTVQDITERRQSDEALRHQAEELARSNTELEQFAYVASHDLREPLRMIASFVDLLGRRYGDRLDQDGLEFIAFAREGAARMDRLVLDLLDYSRIGRICKPMQQVDLGILTERVVRALALKIHESEADIVLPAPPFPTVIGDPDELVRLLQNLIDNAIKYREPTRPIRVTVAAERRGGEVMLSVADNGIGIDPQYYDRIFGIFQRLHTRESFEGTGIGLAICKKIVERHGGQIWVESKPGEGSTFFFTVPTAAPI